MSSSDCLIEYLSSSVTGRWLTWTVQVDEKINDAYFAKSATKGPRSAEEEFFSEGKPKEKEAFPESKAADQKAVDAAVIAAVKKTEHLQKYIKATFGLSKGQFPHQLVF